MRTWCAVKVGLLLLGLLAIYKISLGGWCNEFEMKTHEKWGARYTFAVHAKGRGGGRAATALDEIDSAEAVENLVQF